MAEGGCLLNNCTKSTLGSNPSLPVKVYKKVVGCSLKARH